ncbi:hypothetical protein P4159_05660 [Bacillus thuringiensis]|uniref:hypothetical protein n=1 Tax=Bacillus cereus group TaxID=86661 RepID=UPI000CD9D2C7|nr:MULTISPECIES: hypothetical protein [Bacillus cereus group]MEC3420663.1 hypothetical protein [Bacillus cereus]MEC3596922.1 hypothetical protein [Bacillus thuringiensis]MED1574271.1 hypothetical protein [Bacillus paranthracis]MED1836195.1 hypothetical protein [Bacillus thuringiensis]MED2670258.1 hypothetical protein [Bacillus thuringiensis]
MKNPFKRMPPILYPFYIPLLVVFGFAYIIGWLLGFFQCEKCKKVYWITEEKHEITVYRFETETVCSTCSKC